MQATFTTNDIVIQKLTQILSYLRTGRANKKQKKKDKGKNEAVSICSCDSLIEMLIIVSFTASSIWFMQYLYDVCVCDCKHVVHVEA